MIILSRTRFAHARDILIRRRILRFYRVADRKGNREGMVVICANSAPGVVIIVLSRTIFHSRSSRGMLWIRETRSQDSFSNLLREIREVFRAKGNDTQRMISLVDARNFSVFLIAFPQNFCS